MFHLLLFYVLIPLLRLQVVKDRVSLRALEKMTYQLMDSKEQAELLSATALQPLDVNADGTHTHTLKYPTVSGAFVAQVTFSARPRKGLSPYQDAFQMSFSILLLGPSRQKL